MRTFCAGSLWVVSVVLSIPCVAGELGPGVAEIQNCIEKNLPRSGKQNVVIERTENGTTRRLEALAFWKRDENDRARFLVRIQAPPDERGSAFLFLEGESNNDVFAYLPELGKVRRITPQSVDGSFFASDFTYEDVLELQSQAEHAKVELQGDGTLEGRPVQILVATPSADGSSYSKIVSQVDRETCTVLRAELYARSGQLMKEVVISTADVTKHDTRWIPSKVTMRNLAKGSETRLLFEGADWNANVPDRMFSQTELTKSH